MKLSVLIPAKNEADTIGKTVDNIIIELDAAKIDYEILVVNDGSDDHTEEVLQGLSSKHERFVTLNNTGANGFGLAAIIFPVLSHLHPINY